ncbi:pseudouridine synthase [Kordiimonas pumila]|uniref:Pseudouridine synthase n=1 Tax=Kordiimonas pumila TaxID=2161677 RepID=A0ABV7D692_9PROT|nr:pseudouridine synthase [Kordiimonas pumila]
MTDNEKDINPDEQAGERIAKALARAGIASRREVERMIADGRVSVDGKKLDTPAFLVTTLDGIKVDGEAITQVSETKLWRMHKRRGTLTTHRDPEGRPTVFEKLPTHMGRVISVGRLDMNTEGLLLLTNDGELARWLELPKNEVIRRYRVRVHGRVDERILASLKNGLTIEGTHYGSIEASLERQQEGANAWVTVAIREGKNREVRRVMEHLGLAVNRLIRTHYGPFSLGTLTDGTVAQVGEKQLHEVLSDYFSTEKQSVVAPKIRHTPEKWAKAKPKATKPGDIRRRKAKNGDFTSDRPGKNTSRPGASDRGRGPKPSGNTLTLRPNRGSPKGR